MTKFVRVQLENGAQASVPEAVLKRAGDKIKVLEDQPALDHRGRPSPVKFPQATEPLSPGKDPAQVYADMSAADLRAEIDRRNDGRDGDPLSKGGSKDDMVAALTADDAQNV